MDEPPVKRKRGRPPGKGNPPKPRMADFIDEKESGGVISAPPSVKKPPVPLDLTTHIAPTTMLPKAEEAAMVPNMVQTVLAIRSTVDLDNPATLWNAMDMYINLCANTGCKISNMTMYMACGVERQTIHDWEYGLRRQNNPEYRKFAKMLRMICAAAREQYGLEGQTNPILTIFHQKFYDGLKDNPPDDAAENPLGEIEDPQKLAEKYHDIILD